jgi:hypothetical protein
MSWQHYTTKALEEAGVSVYDVLDHTGYSLRIDVGTRKAIEIYRRGSTIGFSILEWDETGGLIAEDNHTDVSLTDPKVIVTGDYLAEIALSIYSEYE